jgi:N6-adenosine-specific RNA methylase IME4
MAIEEIADLDIPSLTYDDCILWLWTTNAFMEQAHQIARGWGFEIKTILTWVKDRIGTGDWLRGQTEHCLLCVKGKTVVSLTNESTALNAPLREHSRKPDEFYQIVDRICAGKKLDYFSRERREGWESYGSETSKF